MLQHHEFFRTGGGFYCRGIVGVGLVLVTFTQHSHCFASKQLYACIVCITHELGSGTQFALHTCIVPISSIMMLSKVVLS